MKQKKAEFVIPFYGWLIFAILIFIIVLFILSSNFIPGMESLAGKLRFNL